MFFKCIPLVDRGAKILTVGRVTHLSFQLHSQCHGQRPAKTCPEGSCACEKSVRLLVGKSKCCFVAFSGHLYAILCWRFLSFLLDGKTLENLSGLNGLASQPNLCWAQRHKAQANWAAVCDLRLPSVQNVRLFQQPELASISGHERTVHCLRPNAFILSFSH